MNTLNSHIFCQSSHSTADTCTSRIILSLNLSNLRHSTICLYVFISLYYPKTLYVAKVTRLLDVTTDNDLTWKSHIDAITSPSILRLYLLTQLKSSGFLATELQNVHTFFILPKLMYGSQDSSLPKR